MNGEGFVIRLRGHTILCLQGFRGEGYSQGFIENLARIHRDLTEHPETLVTLVDTPDAVCGACPHRAEMGCTLKGDTSEQEMQAQDRHVLALLRFRPDVCVRWGDILDRIRGSITGDSLPNICGRCRWLPLGYCREGIERLRQPDADLIPARALGRGTSSSS
jgi:hypothetical protein